MPRRARYLTTLCQSRPFTSYLHSAIGGRLFSFTQAYLTPYHLQPSAVAIQHPHVFTPRSASAAEFVTRTHKGGDFFRCHGVCISLSLAFGVFALTPQLQHQGLRGLRYGLPIAHATVSLGYAGLCALPYIPICESTLSIDGCDGTRTRNLPRFRLSETTYLQELSLLSYATKM